MEARVLNCVPKHHLDSFYHTVVLPAKRQLDAEYMARATFLSDLKLIVHTVFRRWDSSVMENLLNTAAFEADDRILLFRASMASIQPVASTRVPLPHEVNRPASAEEVTAM